MNKQIILKLNFFYENSFLWSENENENEIPSNASWNAADNQMLAYLCLLKRLLSFKLCICFFSRSFFSILTKLQRSFWLLYISRILLWLPQWSPLNRKFIEIHLSGSTWEVRHKAYARRRRRGGRRRRLWKKESEKHRQSTWSCQQRITNSTAHNSRQQFRFIHSFCHCYMAMLAKAFSYFSI